MPRESTTPSRFPKQLDIHRQHRWGIQGSRHNLNRSQSGNGTHPVRMREGQVRLLLIDECMTDGDCPLHQSPANRRDPSGEYHDNLHLPCVSCRLHLSSRKQQRGGAPMMHGRPIRAAIRVPTTTIHRSMIHKPIANSLL